MKYGKEKNWLEDFTELILNNGIFCGESMFSKVSNASKVGFASFVENSNYKLIDCQVYTQHLEQFGAKHITRNEFVKLLN